MRKILNHLATDWYKYLLELIVITAGVIGAFALNNWNEDRLARIEEQEIYRNLKTDFENSVEEFLFLNNLRDRMIGSTYRIMEISAGYEPSTKVDNELDSLVVNMMMLPTFNGQMGTLNMLFASGRIHLIANNELKQRLIAWPGTIEDMTEEEIYGRDFYRFEVYPALAHAVNYHKILRKYANSISFSPIGAKYGYPDLTLDPKVMQNGYEALFKNQSFINSLAIRNDYTKSSRSETEILIEQANELIHLIEKELK